MRTFKYTYLDAKGAPKESTIEADDKDDAYIILKTMRINPDTITETEAEDISFEVIGEKQIAEEERAKALARRDALPTPGRAGGRHKTADELTIEMLLPVEDLRRGETPKAVKKKYRPPYEMFALFCAGVALLGWSAWATARDTAFLDWPIAKGYIMHTEMLVIGMFGKSYVADIAYRYSIKGEVYRSKNVFSREKETTKGEVMRLLKRYPVGTKVYVHYNPEKPDFAYLEAIADGTSHRLSAVLGLICFAAAVAMFVLAKLTEDPKPKEKPKPKTAPAARKEKEPEITISPWQQR